MNLYELPGNEDHQVYRELETSNYARQYHFLASIINAAIQSNKPWLSESIVKALNFQNHFKSRERHHGRAEHQE